MLQKKPIKPLPTPDTPSPLPKPKQAIKSLADAKGNDRWILSVDGGGIKGILPLQAIKKFQQTFTNANGEVPAITEIFDMCAGTSTGSIVATLLASGKSVDEVIALYEDQTFRDKVFESNLGFRMWAWPIDGAWAVIINIFSGIAALITVIGGLILIFGAVATVATWGVMGAAVAAAVGFLGVVGVSIAAALTFIRGLIIAASLAISTPTYKKGIRKVLKEFFADTKLSELKTDIFITAVDAFRNETAYFTAFNPARAPANYNINDRETIRGLYKDLFARHAVEASMSASTFFAAYERFLDGGVGSYNNPSAIAATEALLFSGWSDEEKAKDNEVFGKNDSLYEKGSTVVWSFGTSQLTEEYDRAELAKEHTALFWIAHLVNHTFASTSSQQNYISEKFLGRYLLENGKPWIKFKRYDLFLNESGLTKIGIEKQKIEDLLIKNSPSIKDVAKLDATEEKMFDEFNSIAKAFANTLDFNIDIMEIGKAHEIPITKYRDDVISALNNVGENELLGDNYGP